ncbi:uncharacterized protein CDAR_604481 [Caerostris darwini]|uniref:Uncharacterized protein n=1 Tax=Caerostris darwini TaxID=1538125 RepID=A0AAV4NEH0_9ARAC|nr:uncharacterized protein CDAR_604481 [Caerostris darwini]
MGGAPNSRWSPKPREVERREERSCGNSKKLKRLVHRFAQTTSLHGVKYMCLRDKSSRIFKTIYRIIFVCCFLFVVINEIVLHEEALGRTTTINSINKDMKAGRDEVPRYFPEYPVITVCRKPPYKADLNSSYLEMVEYIFLTLGFPMVSLTPRELNHVFQMAAYANDYSSKLEPDTLVFKKKLEELENKFQAQKS